MVEVSRVMGKAVRILGGAEGGGGGVNVGGERSPPSP
jgi:hypothetical protein